LIKTVTSVIEKTSEGEKTIVSVPTSHGGVTSYTKSSKTVQTPSGTKSYVKETTEHGSTVTKEVNTEVLTNGQTVT
jgi:hypothetical protein